MPLLRLLLRGPLAAFVLLLFFIFGILNQIFLFFSSDFKKSFAQKNTRWTCRALLFIFGYQGRYDLRSDPKGSFLICNHISYMDVLAIASRIPTLFVTSLEMKRTPFLGWITQIGECLYVDRKSHRYLNKEVLHIQDWLKKGFNVLVFPEATTSDGVNIKNFKSSLLKVADNSKQPIISYSLKYTLKNNKMMSDEEVLAFIPWQEGSAFFLHVFKQLMNSSVGFQLSEVECFSADTFKDRKELTQHLEQSIRKTFNSLQ